MRSTNNLSLRVSALAAVLLGAVGLAACGGGAATERPEPLVIDLRPPLVPPVIPPVVPPAPPPAPPPEPPVVPPDTVDLARARAIAEVPVNLQVAEDAASYAGLYVGGESGLLWRRATDGLWRRIDALVGTVVEGMAYVAPKHALYIVTKDIVGCRLGRLFLSPGALPAFEWLSGGLDGTVLGSVNLTGLAYDTREGTLYAVDSALQGLFRFAHLDTGVAARDAVSLGFTALEDVAYDAINDRLLLLDRQSRAVVNFDHHTLTTGAAVALDFADMRAMTWEQAGTRLVVDRATAALIQFDEAGTVLP